MCSTSHLIHRGAGGSFAVSNDGQGNAALRADVVAVTGEIVSAEIPNLEAYLTRIGYAGSCAPTLETLSAIHRLHAQSIPFENLDPLLRRPVRLELPALEEKLVREGRGGWCFEHNLLLGHVLRHIGFKVTGLAARVLWNAPEGSIRSRAHMLLLIELEGATHIADVGFGGLTLTGPLVLRNDIEQTTPHERFRLVGLDGDFAVQAWLSGTWKSLYRFDLQRQFQADYEVSSWYLANHPGSHFLVNLMAARTEPGRRFALLNNQFTIHELGGESRRRTLTSLEDMRNVLESQFLIRLPDDPRVDATLADLAALPAV